MMTRGIYAALGIIVIGIAASTIVAAPSIPFRDWWAGLAIFGGLASIVMAIHPLRLARAISGSIFCTLAFLRWCVELAAISSPDADRYRTTLQVMATDVTNALTWALLGLLAFAAWWTNPPPVR